MSQKNAVPKLRFPGFNRDWEIIRLGDRVKIYDGTHQTPNYVNKGVPFYSVEHVTVNNFDNTKFVSEEVYESERIKPQKGDILMTRIGDIGTARYIDWDARASFYVSLALIRKSATIDNKYLAQYISAEVFKNELWRRTIHVAFPKKINLGEIGECQVKLPTIGEQEKIAGFLTAVDERIALQDKKVESLKKYKKSITQRIFTQQIRFKDPKGNNYPEWQSERLANILEPGSKVPVDDTSRYKKITVGLAKKGVRFAEFSRKMADKRPFYVRQAGEIIIGKQNYFNGSIAIVGKQFSGTICSNAIMSFMVNADQSSKFIFECISRNDFLKRREALANGTGQKELSEKDFLDFIIDVPSYEEQLKIANLLTSIDEKTKAEELKLEQAKLFKKSLLQRMFI